MEVGLNGVTSMESNNQSVERSDSLGKDAFLNLLVTQLQYQDPLNPMDSADFTSQLAQFSSLEQLNNINESLGYLGLYNASINNSQTVSFIGKTVVATGDSIYLNDEEAVNLNFDLNGDASNVIVYVYDDNNTLVKTIEAGSMNSGEQSVTWDGTDNEEQKLSAGKYSFEVVATNTNGDLLETTTYTSGKVTGVIFRDGTTYLLLDDLEIPVGNVIKVTEA
jgi:flagellar basal-body rod modification protein FlgD